MSLCPIVMSFTLYRLSHILIYRRYRKWKLGNDIELIARCEHDAVGYGPKDELQYINVKALSEWDSKVRTPVRWGTGVISIGQCDDAGVYGPNRPIHPCVITLPQSFKVPLLIAIVCFFRLPGAWSGEASWTARRERCWPRN